MRKDLAVGKEFEDWVLWRFLPMFVEIYTQSFNLSNNAFAYNRGDT